MFLNLFLDFMDESSVSRIHNVPKWLIIFLHVSCHMNGLSVVLSPHHERTVRPLVPQ